MKSSYFRKAEAIYVPKTMINDFRLEALDEQGQWQTVKEIKATTSARSSCRWTWKPSHPPGPSATWGAEDCHIFSFDIS